MRIADAQWIPATVHQTWEALHDPGVLQRCIPGCMRVERLSPSEYAFTVRSRVGGLEADYEGEILLSDVDAPHACTLAFEGKGRAAGLAIGTAQVNLSDKDNGTRVAYTVAGQVGGKLAEIGEPAVLKAAEKLVERFFAAFTDHAGSLPRLPPPPPPPAPPEKGLCHSRWSWAVVAAVILVLVAYHTFIV